MKLKLLNALTAAILFLMPIATFAQTPTLGTAAKFVLFTTNGAMTCSGTKYLTHLTGDVGSNLPGSVTGFGNVDGVMHDFDVASGLCVPDVVSLYTQLSTAIPTGTLASPFGNGVTLTPGVYSIPTAATLNLDITLDAVGNPAAVFIFQIAGVFTTNASAKVKLVNGAKACNVFWQVGGAVNVGTGTYLRGTIVANGQIDMTSTLDTLEGRAFALNAAVLVSQLVAFTPIGCGSPYLTGPAAPALASTASYGVFSSIGAVTSTPITYVIGDVGANSTTPTGFNPLNVTGTIHAMDPSTAAAASDLTIAYNYLVAMPADIQLLDPPDFGHGLVLTPHSYQLTGITQLTGDVILNAQGNPNAVFVIKMNGAFTTGSLSRIVLINGTQAKNVYWKIDGAVNIFSNSVFNGTLVVAGAITLNTGDTLNGRALTINGAIAINGSYVNINPPPCVAAPITGVLQVCQGSTTILANIDSGGTWVSNNPLVATIGSTTGIVTGITPGTDTITYTSPLACVITAVVTVNPATAPILGPSSVCVGSTITLTDATLIGTWSSSNILQASVGSITGVVTGLTPGTPTITYLSGSGCAATKTLTVNALPDAGVISGASNVCVSSSIVLTDANPGGVWSSSNSSATVVGGTVTGMITGVDTISYSVTNLCGTATAVKVLTVSPLPNAGSITGPSSVCVGSSIVLTDTNPGGVWSSSNSSASVVGGTVTGIINGTDTISYSLTNSCGTSVATKILTVNPLPNAGSIIGSSSVCVGSSTVLTDTNPGGAWSSSNSSATVVGGTVTGIVTGIDTINYTFTNSCGSAIATKVLTVSPLPNAGSISGPSSVCVGSSIILSDANPGGTWSSSNSNATVLGGTVTGIISGIDTISYSVTNSCGLAIATKVTTINPLPNAGTISGLASVCVGSSIILTDANPGGTWSSSNSNATVVGGTATGIITGIDTISYSVTNSCGTAIATKVITVNALPNGGSISGPSNVCVGASITLTDLAPGGIWSSSSAIATVSGGVVTGVSAGTALISYTVTNTCGTATATKAVTVSPLANAGTISGPSSVCVGSSITLTVLAPGGTWSSSNTNATVTGGVVTGVSAGSNTISYSVTNSCGTAIATTAITVNPLPNAGSITGSSNVCVGSTITLTDGVSGGTWSSSNATATVLSGVVTGLVAGIDTISYSVTNSCGTATTTKVIAVDPLPNAGSISGPSVVCVGSAITLTDGISGGIWSSSNTNTTVTGGLVVGVYAGTSTISYTVTNICGTATATKALTINPLPNAGIITGVSNVCVGSTITLADAATGGTWSSSNATATVSGGVITGVLAGIDTIYYSVTNLCGTATVSMTITVNPLPNAGVINGASSVCVSASITLTNSASGGSWTSSNTNAVVSGGIVTGVTAGTDTIAYTVTNLCGTDIATKIITINPLPNAGNIAGNSGVCIGSSITLTNFIAGGVWSASNNSASVSGGVVTGITAGTDTISYAVTNVCGTAIVTKTIIVNLLPVFPVISTKSPASVCKGTMYQNFGAATLPPANTAYQWTANNAIVWAQGTGHQYALISFTQSGVSTVYLNATINGTGCTNKTTIAVNVGTNSAETDVVSYFNNHLVCTPNDEGNYQWGFDDKRSLDSTILVGEINQDFISTSADFVNKSYWVMTTKGSCMQKTYYSTPTFVQNTNSETSIYVYPNPANTYVNIAISSSLNTAIQVDVLNMMGQKVSSIQVIDNKVTVDVSAFATGVYMINCYRDGIKIAGSKFIKN